MEPKTVVVTHADSPHDDGYMFGCPACEYGDCVCVNEPTWGPCVSVHCKRADESEPGKCVCGRHATWSECVQAATATDEEM